MRANAVNGQGGKGNGMWAGMQCVQGCMGAEGGEAVCICEYSNCLYFFLFFQECILCLEFWKIYIFLMYFCFLIFVVLYIYV